MNTNDWTPPSIPPTDAQIDRYWARFLVAINGLVTEARFNRQAAAWLSVGDRSFLKIDAWRELPDPPPKLDAFEAWAKPRLSAPGKPWICVLGATISVQVARSIWNAAIASAKGQP